MTNTTFKSPSGASNVTSVLIDAIRKTVGNKGCLLEPDDMAVYLTDRRSALVRSAPLVVRPATTQEVSEVLRLCHEANVGVVPQGGNTGLVEGSVPDISGGQIVLSLSRMRSVRELDVSNATLTVEAGAVLADVQRAADDAGMLFPLSLAAEGSCQIGGNLSTNAGGTAVIRYGNARDLVLGIEAVLSDGRIWNGLRALRKDNTGYDLKHLFIGSEGTLGVITAVVLKLFPKPQEQLSALVAVASARDASNFLSRCQRACGENISSFEYIHRNCLELVFEKIPGSRDPLDEVYGHYVLLELGSSTPGTDLRAVLETLLEEAFAAEEVENATIAATIEQSNALWKLREDIPEATRITGTRIGHDVAVPVALIADFLERGSAIVERMHPSARLIPFGHMGDGNIHFNMVAVDDAHGASFLEPESEIRRAIYDLVHEMGGSFSAEHGIGGLKKSDLVAYRSPVELDLMRTLKHALDPKNILNPGKVL